MKKTLIVPLVLLASISTLTSCSQGSQKTDTLMPVISTGSIDTGALQIEAIEVMTDTPQSMTGVHGDVLTPTPTVPTPPVEGAPVTRTSIESYQSPAGLDQIEFTVTVEKGAIATASAKVMATNDATQYNQENFAKNVSAQVVGKSIKDFHVDTIGGASLTTAAFEKFVQSL